MLLAQVAERAAREGWLDEVVVAQFDHGTRESARADQELVVRRAKELGVRAIHALSLPARCAPVTAGQFVAQTVLAMLRERGEGI